MVILVCGRLCSGKTTYVKELVRERSGVHLSCDELMLHIFDPLLGDKFDEISAKCCEYLYTLAERISDSGGTAVLDFGFWMKKQREELSARFAQHEWHYLDVSDEEWHRRIAKRNELVAAGKVDAYYVDDGLMQKFESRFEKPERSEIDVWVESD